MLFWWAEVESIGGRGGRERRRRRQFPLRMDIINGGSKNAFPLEFRAFLFWDTLYLKSLTPAQFFIPCYMKYSGNLIYNFVRLHGGWNSMSFNPFCSTSNPAASDA